DANQGGYAQGQYARERGRHEQSGHGHGGRDVQGGAGQGGHRQHGMGQDDDRARSGWESSRYAQHGYDDRGRWGGRDDEHRGHFGRGFDARGRDRVGREGS